MDKMYIFRYDPTYPDEGPDKLLLENHNGMTCFADIGARQRPISLVGIRFEDGYESCAFVYELEEVNDGQ
jgi:hypothetical protein